MINKQGILILAVILFSPTFALADNIPGHFKGGNKYVTLSEGFTDQEDLQNGSARCNLLFSLPKENGLQTTSIGGASLSEIAKGANGPDLDMQLSTGMDSDSRRVKGVDFDANQSASSEKEKGKGWGKRNAGDGNGIGVGSVVPSPLSSVAEPELQTLLLFGLTGLGMVYYRRKTVRIAF